jgi:hypothetical protein
MAVTEVIYSYMDESKQPCRIGLNLEAIEDDGSNWDTVVSNVGSSLALLGTSLSTIMDCDEYQSRVASVRAKNPPTYPSEKSAQREWVARMTYADDVTGDQYRFDIPGPDPDIFIAGTQEVDMANIAVAAFKIVFDANVKSKDGNAVTLVRGKRQGKRA